MIVSLLISFQYSGSYLLALRQFKLPIGVIYHLSLYLNDASFNFIGGLLRESLRLHEIYVNLVLVDRAELRYFCGWRILAELLHREI